MRGRKSMVGRICTKSETGSERARGLWMVRMVNGRRKAKREAFEAERLVRDCQRKKLIES